MSDQTKLEFAEWIKVRDTLEELIQTIYDSNGGIPNGKHVAEELMAAGLIDVAAILGYEVVEEDETPEWVPTHNWRESDETTTARAPVRLVRLRRRIGALSALVEDAGGNPYKALLSDLEEILP